jgi:hypothetical protein
MNTTVKTLSMLILLGVGFVPSIAAQPTAISYEGYFTVANAPAQGLYDFRFTLYDLPDNGATVAVPIFTEDLSVQQGRFRVPLDFGDGAFDGEPRWLEIAIRPGADAGDFTVLTPRQQLTPTPYALHAYRAGSVADGAILGTGIAPGTLDASHLLVPTGPQPGQVLGFDGNGFLWTAPVAGGDSVFSLNGTSAYYVAGAVGLGTANPRAGYRLDVAGAARIAPGGLGGAIQFGTPSFETGMTIAGDARADVRFDGNTLKLVAGPAGGPPGPESGVAVHTSGNVGVGTTSPQAKLHVSGDLRYDGHQHELDVADNFAAYVRAADFFLGHSSRRGAPGRALVDFGESLVLNFGNDWGKTVIGSGVTEVLSYDFLLGHPSRRGAPGRALVDFGESLVVNFGNDWGTTVIGGSVTEVQTLRITGGADLAEPFAFSEQDIDPGSVVVIDEKHPGQLKLSTEAYDTRVAGIVSGANGVKPGIALHQEGLIEGNHNVALTGRVYAQADARFGPIRPGDLLTTSDTPGHAMKVTDPARAQGAIIGKAMSALTEGSGMVLVLVTLQ